MSGFERKLRREKLKKQLGSNDIKEIFHSKYDTLEQRLVAGMKRAKEDNLKNKRG